MTTPTPNSIDIAAGLAQVKLAKHINRSAAQQQRRYTERWSKETTAGPAATRSSVATPSSASVRHAARNAPADLPQPTGALRISLLGPEPDESVETVGDWRTELADIGYLAVAGVFVVSSLAAMAGLIAGLVSIGWF